MPTTMQTPVSVTIDAIDVSQLRAIELADGWHDINACEFVQFTVGEAHSPITPSKLYPALKYQDRNGKTVRTLLSQVLSFSEEPQAGR
jgi:hypothetical protein